MADDNQTYDHPMHAQYAQQFTQVSEQFTRMSEQFTQVNERITHMNEQFNHMNERMNYMNEQILALVDQQGQNVSRSPTLHSQDKIPQYLDRPPKFDGKNRSACETFVSQCKHYINACPESVFPTEDDKINFIISYLKDGAYDWVKPHLAHRGKPNAHAMFSSFEQFCQHLLTNKGETDQRATNNRKLRALRQTGSASQYTSDFLQLAAGLEWGDEALRTQYKHGLSGDLKDFLAWRDHEPTTLTELTEAAIKADNRIFERKLEARADGKHRVSRAPASYPAATSSVTRPHPTAANVQHSNSSNHSRPVPMDIDGTARRYKPLTAQERAERKAKNLCLYCGNAGHQVHQCPAKPQPRGSSASATSTTAPQQEPLKE